MKRCLIVLTVVVYGISGISAAFSGNHGPQSGSGEPSKTKSFIEKLTDVKSPLRFDVTVPIENSKEDKIISPEVNKEDLLNFYNTFKNFNIGDQCKDSKDKKVVDKLKSLISKSLEALDNVLFTANGDVHLPREHSSFFVDIYSLQENLGVIIREIGNEKIKDEFNKLKNALSSVLSKFCKKETSWFSTYCVTEIFDSYDSSGKRQYNDKFRFELQRSAVEQNLVSKSDVRKDFCTVPTVKPEPKPEPEPAASEAGAGIPAPGLVAPVTSVQPVPPPSGAPAAPTDQSAWLQRFMNQIKESNDKNMEEFRRKVAEDNKKLQELAAAGGGGNGGGYGDKNKPKDPANEIAYGAAQLANIDAAAKIAEGLAKQLANNQVPIVTPSGGSPSSGSPAAPPAPENQNQQPQLPINPGDANGPHDYQNPQQGYPGMMGAPYQSPTGSLISSDPPFGPGLFPMGGPDPRLIGQQAARDYMGGMGGGMFAGMSPMQMMMMNPQMWWQSMIGMGMGGMGPYNVMGQQGVPTTQTFTFSGGARKLSSGSTRITTQQRARSSSSEGARRGKFGPLK